MACISRSHNTLLYRVNDVIVQFQFSFLHLPTKLLCRQSLSTKGEAFHVFYKPSTDGWGVEVYLMVALCRRSAVGIVLVGC